MSLAHGQRPPSAPTPSPSPHHSVSTPASFLSYMAPTVCVRVRECKRVHVYKRHARPTSPPQVWSQQNPPPQAFLYTGRPFSPPPLFILSPPGLSLLRPSRCPAHTLCLLTAGRDPRLPDEWATEHPTTGLGGPAGQELLALAWGRRRCRNLKWPPAQTCPLPLRTSLTPATHCDLPSEHHLVTRSARMSTCLPALGSHFVPGSGLQRSSRHRACPVGCTGKLQAHVGVIHTGTSLSVLPSAGNLPFHLDVHSLL